MRVWGSDPWSLDLPGEDPRPAILLLKRRRTTPRLFSAVNPEDREVRVNFCTGSPGWLKSICCLRPDGSFPMSQRSFPPSFWNSTYQPSSVPASLGSPLAATTHSELPFATADPYSPGSLHSHLHQGGPEPWHPAHHHHHHHHHHPYIGTQSSPYPRPTTVHEVYGPHFDPRYGSLLVPAASVRPHRLTPGSVPTPVSPQCELGKSEPATSAWTTPAPFTSPAGEMAQSLGLNVDTGLQPQDKGKDLYWF
ncbi:hypothetical protein JD844_024398 [Phrynosoma platyrhinos]|uniref:Uncharacterized protein n=1 Tax=Phrynosoma platyrhinos TaxID=52577 RepID=A0ABQ7SY65_PHRPL|nr:hypothetical protein JD844_024398 [Phrynosoma platyrhinos]